MKAKYLVRKLGGFILAALMLTGIGVLSSASAQAQGRRQGRVIVRPNPYRVYRPYGYRSWWGRPYGYYDPFYDPYDPFSPYGSYYSQYIFRNGEAALDQGYHDGLKTGSADGRKHKSYDPERSHYFHDAGFGNFAEAYREGFSNGYRAGYGPA